MVEKTEAKVLFKEGNDLRVLRGQIVAEDDTFVCLRRRNGTFRISKAHIVKISQPREGSR